MKRHRQVTQETETQKKRRRKELAPISLSGLDLETAIKAAISTGPITDPKLKKRRRKSP
jgi:hypothetical protein